MTDSGERYFSGIDDRVKSVKSMLNDIKGDMKWLLKKHSNTDANKSLRATIAKSDGVMIKDIPWSELKHKIFDTKFDFNAFWQSLSDQE